MYEITVQKNLFTTKITIFIVNKILFLNSNTVVALDDTRTLRSFKHLSLLLYIGPMHAAYAIACGI